MVLGIGEGKLEIILDKQIYHPGETIKGTVKLTLNKPLKAKELRVVFYGESRRSSGRRGSSTVRVYEHRITLDGGKEYPAGTADYPFEMVLPEIQKPMEAAAAKGYAPPKKNEAGDGPDIVGGVISVLDRLTDPVRNLPWYLDASLDVSMSFDISRKIKLDFRRPEG